MGTMRALVYEGPRIMNIRELPIPVPHEDEAIIRVERVGICGSELSGYLGHNSLRTPPLVMGHEFAGTIHALGNSSTSFKIGDRVTANPLVSCGTCLDCLHGKAQLCSTRNLLGAHRPGAFAEYLVVPNKNLFLLPDSMTFEEGALAEPFACGVHICRLLRLDPSEKLFIVGAGPIGLFALQAAQLIGLHDIVVMDLNQERLNMVKALGGIPVSSIEELEGLKLEQGFHASIDAVGRKETRQISISYLRPGGRVCFSGLHEADSSLPINTMIRNEISTYSAFAYTPCDFTDALQWLKEKKVSILQWSKIQPLEQGQDCFEKLLHSPGNVAKFILAI